MEEFNRFEAAKELSSCDACKATGDDIWSYDPDGSLVVLQILKGDGNLSWPLQSRPVITLEAHMKEVKASLKGLELSSARIEVTLTNLSTKAESATALGKIDALEGRTKALETAVSDTVKIAVGKAIGPMQLPAIIVSTIVLLGLLLVAWNWITRQPWFHG